MRFSDNGYYIEKYVKCANCGMLVYGAGHRGPAPRQGLRLLLRLVRRVGGQVRQRGRLFPPADRAAAAADRRRACRGSATSTARPGDDEHPRFDHGVDLPGDGHPADEDVLLDDLQRGARLHLRPRRRQGRHDRLRRVLPDDDRRHAAADQDLRAGDPVRHAGGGRHHPPQRPLSRRAALPGAHLLQAVLRRRRAAGLCRLHRPHRRDRRHGARRLLRRGDRDLPRGAARAAGEDQEARPATSRRSGSCCSPTSARRARTSATCGR